MYKGQIPFIDDRPQQEVISWKRDKIEWRDNTPFFAVMKLEDKVNSGGHTRNLTVIDEHKINYTMFVKDFLNVAIKGKVKEGGYMAGEWCFCKRGTKYGVCLYEEEE